MTDLFVPATDYFAFPRLQTRRRSEWHAVFNTNSLHHIWGFAQFGRTQIENRHFVNPAFESLYGIAEALRDVRPQGGRFFIGSLASSSQIGAYYRTPESEYVLFARIYVV